MIGELGSHMLCGTAEKKKKKQEHKLLKAMKIHRAFKYMCMYVLVIQSCSSLCDHMDYSPPGSSVHGILQARILE